jgi:hypothetical protein
MNAGRIQNPVTWMSALSFTPDHWIGIAFGLAGSAPRDGASHSFLVETFGEDLRR